MQFTVISLFLIQLTPQNRNPLPIPSNKNIHFHQKKRSLELRQITNLRVAFGILTEIPSKLWSGGDVELKPNAKALCCVNEYFRFFSLEFISSKEILFGDVLIMFPSFRFPCRIQSHSTLFYCLKDTATWSWL